MNSDAQQFLSLAEAAEMLGYANANTLRLWAREGRIPGVLKIGKTWAIPYEWVKQHETHKEPIGKGWRRGKQGKLGE